MVATKKSKKSVKKVPASTQTQVSKESLLAIAAFVLPFLAWLVAAIANPSGWASDYPTIIVALIIFLATSYWPIGLIAGGMLVLYFALQKKAASKRFVSLLLMTASVVYSAYIYHLTITADESEFTG